MKRIIALLLCLMLALPALSFAEEEKVLNILSWLGYVDDETLADFETETGIKVVWSPMESNESMLLKLSQGGAAEYDLVLASDYALDVLRQQGLIQKLDLSKLSNYANLDESFLNQSYDPANEYVIPYMAGCPLIIYDSEKVPFEITSYADLWDERLKDNVSILDNARVTCGITLKTMGKSINETDPAVLEQMKAKLMSLRPNIRTANDTESYTAIATGDANVGFLFTPYVFMVQNDRETNKLPLMKVVYPKEGLGFGVDGLVIPASAPHTSNAHLFLDFLMRPDVAAHNAESQMYMCVNKAATDYLSAQYLENPIFNVPSDLLNNAEMVQNVGTTDTLYQEIYTAFINQ
ncbi:MAG: spermidine/putrescine ABC transporter substrate-binding protein [Clostridia bacterium]